MNNYPIPHDAYVLVGDGRKALFLRNHGDERFPNLRAERVFERQNPRSSDQGSDHPGRAFAPADTHRRSSVGATDWHELQEHRFAREVADVLEQLVRTQDVKALAIIAPPKTLAELRRAIHSNVKARVFAEIDKDLTKHPMSDIERYFAG